MSDVIDHNAEPAAQALCVGVQLADGGKIYNYDPGPLALEYGDRVVVGTDRGNTLGRVVVPPQPVVSESDAPKKRVVKKAEPRDLAREDSNLARARDALRICLHRIREREMPMKLVKAECAFEGSKIVFYFAAENRVDFRDLVRDLANTLSARIEMRQIGARDETKAVGGVGPCGRELCCSSWMREFAPVTLAMAKKQGLSLKPSRLAGMCGRLKCCLRYEYDTYVELGRPLPNVGKKVVSVKGDGVIVGQNVLKQTVMIKRDEDGVRVEATLEDLVEEKPQQ